MELFAAPTHALLWVRHKGKKARTIVHRDFGEHFTIQIDARAFQSTDKFAVGNSAPRQAALIRTIHSERKLRFFSRRPTKP